MYISRFPPMVWISHCCTVLLLHCAALSCLSVRCQCHNIISYGFVFHCVRKWMCWTRKCEKCHLPEVSIAPVKVVLCADVVVAAITIIIISSSSSTSSSSSSGGSNNLSLGFPNLVLRVTQEKKMHSWDKMSKTNHLIIYEHTQEDKQVETNRERFSVCQSCILNTCLPNNIRL